MSAGMPVAHVGEKVSGDVIVTGSPTVHVGSAAVGLADRASACVPGVGHPVNPMLGCKLLPEEVDFALMAPDTLAFGRGYLSSNPGVSRLGQGWWLTGESMALELNAEACVLIDAQGRRIRFPALLPGQVLYSGSEQLWLRRGGNAAENSDIKRWSGRWSPVPEEFQSNPNAVVVLADNSYLCFFRQSDQLWRLHSTFGRSGYQTVFSWSPRGFLTNIRDCVGRCYVLVYQHACEAGPTDDGIRLAGVILASSNGSIPEHFNPQATGHDWLVRYQFNASGDLISVRDRMGEIVRVFDWTNHIMTAHGEPGGMEVRYEWDACHPNGKVVKQSETEGLTREFRYHPDATDVIDSLGRIERYEFSGDGGERRWTALIRADGSRTEFEHDLFGRQVAVRDPLGRVSRRRLDGQGRVLEEESPGKLNYRVTLDTETGLPAELVDRLGRLWIFERDERANLISVTGPSGTTRYHYEDPALPDRPTQIIDEKGGVKRLQWNCLGLPAHITDCSGHTHHYEYDGEGRLVAETDADGQTSRYSHNLIGQVIRVTTADGNVVTHRYDAQGRQTHVSDAQGVCTQFSWDRYDRLLCATDAAGATLTYRYDAAGRLCSHTNQNGQTTTFTYDVNDRLIEEIGFDGRCQQHVYNLADERVTLIDEGRETHYQYDRDSRLISRTLPTTDSGPRFTEHYTWHADGRLATVKTPESEVRFAYDDAGNLALESQIHADGWVYSVAHQHGPLGVRESTQYGDAPPVNWLTYGSGHLHGVIAAHIEMAFERDGMHREQFRDARLRGSSQALFTQQREYDPVGHLIRSHLHSDAADDWQRVYRYDGLGQLTHIGDNLKPALRYEYDLSGQLIASHRANQPVRRYSYDQAGNRLDLGGNPSTDANQHHEHNELYRSGYVHSDSDTAQAPHTPSLWAGNRVERFGGHVYRFDAHGNLTSREGPDGEHLRLTYDGADRLVHLVRTHADGQITEAHYHYDGLSRRISKRVIEGETQRITRYGWDGERQCAEVTDDLLRTTVHEPDSFVPLLRIEQTREPDSPELLAVRQDMAAADQPLPVQCLPTLGKPAMQFFHTDHIGTPLQLSDERGQVIWSADSDDWRAVTAERGAYDQPIRFQGQYHDEESGLYYNRHRYYLPEAGRYATQDPIGLRGGPNGYAYALNAPSIAYDPSGLFIPLVIVGAWLARAAIGAAIGATVEVGMQAGKQVWGQMKDNWDEGRDLTDIKWRCIDINWKHVAISAGAGAIAPGMFASAKTIFKSAKAIKTISGQAANTANRAAKLVARKAAHIETIGSAVVAQTSVQTAKALGKCVTKNEHQECPQNV
ncbi:RHS repeat-associated core domain-containing protein [Pseudomonas sp. Pseu.R1]|uniref:RHS repeat-associated core domain-containing protein n=1 Tax=Pseudomonas sp. Pseu.R1 TaxID=3379818 RepID=UPI003B952F87